MTSSRVCVFFFIRTHTLWGLTKMGPLLLHFYYEVLSLFALACRNKWILQIQLNARVCVRAHVCAHWPAAGRKLSGFSIGDGDTWRRSKEPEQFLLSSSLNLSPMAACCSSSRLAGRPCAALHQTTRTNAEVRHACQGAPHTLVSARGGRSPLTCDPSLSAGPSVLDRVLESTSTKEKMAKYQAAVFKQCGAQPVSSYSADAMDTRASRMMRPYLCVQPAEFPSSASLSLCFVLPPRLGLQRRWPSNQQRQRIRSAPLRLTATVSGCEPTAAKLKRVPRHSLTGLCRFQERAASKPKRCG